MNFYFQVYKGKKQNSTKGFVIEKKEFYMFILNRYKIYK